MFTIRIIYQEVSKKVPCPTSEILTFIGLLDIASEMSEKQNKKVLFSLKKQRWRRVCEIIQTGVEGREEDYILVLQNLT